MKELEEENLNEVEEIKGNEEVETTEFSDEEIEMVELSEDAENDVGGGGGSNFLSKRIYKTIREYANEMIELYPLKDAGFLGFDIDKTYNCRGIDYRGGLGKEKYWINFDSDERKYQIILNGTGADLRKKKNLHIRLDVRLVNVDSGDNASNIIVEYNLYFNKR